MNIGIMIDSLHIGGAERMALYLSEYFTAMGHKVLFFIPYHNKGQSFSYNERIISFHYMTGENKVENFLNLMRTASEIRKYKKKYHLEVVISFMEDCNHINVLSKAHEKTIISVRTTLSSRDEFTGLIYDPRFIKYVYNRADSVISVSDYTRRDLITNYGIKEKIVKTIPNPAVKLKCVEDLEWSYGEEVILHVGRLDPVKQQDRIIRAFSYVLRHKPGAKLIILGDGRIRNYLKLVSKNSGVKDSVVFVGYTENVGFYLKYSKVFVMASKAEGFPNAMVEAMSYGVPVVSADSPGGCPEIIGKKTEKEGIQYCEYGILTPYVKGRAPRNTKLEEEEIFLGQAMLALLSDDELRSKYSKKALERAAYYDVARVRKLWEEEICY